MLTSDSTIMALDVGGRRIGVATANAVARIAHPLKTIYNTEVVLQEIQTLCKEHNVEVLVLGLPRGLQGQRTAQTEAVEAFGASLRQYCGMPLYWQDEAVTSHKAKQELLQRKKEFRKEDVDALAATYILEDFLDEHPEFSA